MGGYYSQDYTETDIVTLKTQLLGGIPYGPCNMRTFMPSHYVGCWHEIYRSYSKNEEDVVGTTTSYLLSNMDILVTNTYLHRNNTYSTRMGKAVLGNVAEPWAYILTFADIGSSEGPSDYVIHWTDYYNYAVVGSKDKFYLLARKPAIPARILILFQQYIQDRGYSIDKAVFNSNITII